MHFLNELNYLLDCRKSEYSPTKSVLGAINIIKSIFSEYGYNLNCNKIYYFSEDLYKIDLNNKKCNYVVLIKIDYNDTLNIYGVKVKVKEYETKI